MASLCCPFFPLDVLDEIWDLIESVSGGFLTYSFLSLFIQCFGVIKHKYVWQVFLPNFHLNIHSCIYVYIFSFHQ